jgi:hypothetical protein
MYVEETSQQVVYGLTNLTPTEAGPQAIATFSRDHWAVENRLHWRRDVQYAIRAARQSPDLPEQNDLQKRPETISEAIQLLKQLNEKYPGSLDTIKVSSKTMGLTMHCKNFGDLIKRLEPIIKDEEKRHVIDKLIYKPLRETKRLNYPGKCGRLQTSRVWRKKMELTEELKDLLIKTGEQLKGSARRLFMAHTVKTLGPSGASRAERDLGWNRKTIRKGMHELESGITCIDAFEARGRKRAEEHLPNLLTDMRAIVDGQSQTDPQFKTNRLYTRLTATEVRRQLISKQGYTDEQLPTPTTIGTKLNEMGYFPMKVAKSKPQKRSQPPMPSSSRSIR